MDNACKRLWRGRALDGRSSELTVLAKHSSISYPKAADCQRWSPLNCKTTPVLPYLLYDAFPVCAILYGNKNPYMLRFLVGMYVPRHVPVEADTE